MATTTRNMDRSGGGRQSRGRGHLAVLAGLVLTGSILLVMSLFPSAKEGCSGPAAASAMPRIHVVGSRLYAGTKPWRAWGLNWGYGDHSAPLEYLDNPTSANLSMLRCELATARRLGANSMRVYVELGHVMRGPSQVRPGALSALRKLLSLAASERIYLDIAGNLVWRPARVPRWYDRLSESARWQVQANFWRAVAHAAAGSPAVLCYALTSEPIISDAPGYYAGDFGGWKFNQIIAHPHGRDHRALARAWTRQLAAAVRSQDNRPVTIGLLPATTGGFSPGSVADLLDMLVIHEYPRDGKAAASIALVRHFASFGKPVLLGETFPLFSGGDTEREFLLGATPYLVGALEFFDGRDPNRMIVRTMSDALYQAALRQFISLRGAILNPVQVPASRY